MHAYMNVLTSEKNSEKFIFVLMNFILILDYTRTGIDLPPKEIRYYCYVREYCCYA